MLGLAVVIFIINHCSLEILILTGPRGHDDKIGGYKITWKLFTIWVSFTVSKIM